MILRLLTGLFLSLPLAGWSVEPAADKLYLIEFATGPNWDPALTAPAQPHFKEHSANLARLHREGRLTIGARHGDKGMILLRAADEAAVQHELTQDPSIAAGTFTARIEEFRPFYHGSTLPPPVSPEIAVVQEQLAAFNRHDADAVVAHYAEDIKWLSLDGDNLTVEGSDRASIHTWLKGYFKARPTVRSEYLEINQTGPYVVFRERAGSTHQDGTFRSQDAIGIFEVRDGLVRRAWYYPAARDQPAAK